MLHKINGLKTILNKELEKKDRNSEEVLVLSKKIDKLIVQYYLKEYEKELGKNV